VDRDFILFLKTAVAADIYPYLPFLRSAGALAKFKSSRQGNISNDSEGFEQISGIYRYDV
jgi:hypothetical protein